MSLAKRLSAAWISGVAWILLSFGAQAEEPIKIATIDVQKALQTVEAGKKAKSQLESIAKSKNQEIQKEETAFQKAYEDFQKQALVMNDQAKAKKNAELQERWGKLQEQKMRAKAEFDRKEAELTEPIITKIREVVKGLAKERKYSLVLDKNEGRVLFSEDKDDLTQEVINKYNKSKSAS